MAQQYDVSLKLLFRHSHGLIARRLFGGEVVEWLNVELPKVANPRVDLLARMEDGSLRHVDAQATNDAALPRRLAEYYLGFHRLIGEHVEQVVLYIGREPLRMPAVFETPSMHYRFELLDIRDFDGEPLIESDDWGDNVLALLASEDQERVFRRVSEQIRKLRGEERKTAEEVFVILSGIIGVEETAARRVNMMIDLMENKVIGPEILRRERKILLLQLNRRFGTLPEWALQKIHGANEDELMIWAERIVDDPSLEAIFRS